MCGSSPRAAAPPVGRVNASLGSAAASAFELLLLTAAACQFAELRPALFAQLRPLKPTTPTRTTVQGHAAVCAPLLPAQVAGKRAQDGAAGPRQHLRRMLLALHHRPAAAERESTRAALRRLLWGGAPRCSVEGSPGVLHSHPPHTQQPHPTPQQPHPTSNAPQLWRNVFACLRTLLGALCIALVAFGLSGPPFVHAALLILLLIATRSQALVCALIVVAVGALGVLYGQGLRVAVQIDHTGRLGVALLRWAAAAAAALVRPTVLGVPLSRARS